MDTGFIVTMVIAIVIGVAAGMFIEKIRNTHKYSHGTLNVDCSNPKYEPGMYLQLTVPIEDVISKKQVTFSVNVIRYNSQE